MKRFENQVILITGGAGGLGRALVERFVAEGASVVVLDRAKAKLDTLAAEFAASVVTVEGDVTRLADNRRAVAVAVECFGKLDTFIANAGVFDFGIALVDLPDDQIDAAFDEVFGINVKGYLLGAKAALPELVRSRGSLIFTLSAASAHAACGGPLYTASKHAGVGLVRELAYELAPHVRVNGVAPGAHRTTLAGPRALGLHLRSVAEMLPPDHVAAQFEPMGRFAEAHEHVGPYLMLASREDGRTLTGEVLYANGGVSIRGIVQPAGGQGLAARFDTKRTDA